MTANNPEDLYLEAFLIVSSCKVVAYLWFDQLYNL
jgi:hypothetical protein